MANEKTFRTLKAKLALQLIRLSIPMSSAENALWCPFKPSDAVDTKKPAICFYLSEINKKMVLISFNNTSELHQIEEPKIQDNFDCHELVCNFVNFYIENYDKGE